MHMDDERKIHVAEERAERFDEETVAPAAEENAEEAAHEGEQESFAKQLANDAPARRTERESQRDLLRARSAASEQHIGEIETGDEKDGAGHTGKQNSNER